MLEEKIRILEGTFNEKVNVDDYPEMEILKIEVY